MFNENKVNIYYKNIVKWIVYLGRQENSTKFNRANTCTMKTEIIKLFNEKI